MNFEIKLAWHQVSLKKNLCLHTISLFLCRKKMLSQDNIAALTLKDVKHRECRGNTDEQKRRKNSLQLPSQRWSNTIRCHTISFNAIQYFALPCNTLLYLAIPYNAVQYHTIPCYTLQYHTIPYNAIQYHEIPCYTLQYHTIPCSILSSQRWTRQRTSADATWSRRDKKVLHRIFVLCQNFYR